MFVWSMLQFSFPTEKKEAVTWLLKNFRGSKSHKTFSKSAELLFALSKIWRGLKETSLSFLILRKPGKLKGLNPRLPGTFTIAVEMNEPSPFTGYVGFLFFFARSGAAIRPAAWIHSVESKSLKKILSCKDKFHKFHSTKAHAHFQLPLWCCTKVWLLCTMLIFCPTKS